MSGARQTGVAAPTYLVTSLVLFGRRVLPLPDDDRRRGSGLGQDALHVGVRVLAHAIAAGHDRSTSRSPGCHTASTLGLGTADGCLPLVALANDTNPRLLRGQQRRPGSPTGHSQVLLMKLTICSRLGSYPSVVRTSIEGA
jgi:hypothetical protein